MSDNQIWLAIAIASIILYVVILACCPKYRIVEKNDGKFYIQRRCFLMCYCDDLNDEWFVYDACYTVSRQFNSLKEAQDFTKDRYEKKRFFEPKIKKRT